MYIEWDLGNFIAYGQGDKDHEMFKLIPFARWNKDKQGYNLPNVPATVLAVQSMFKNYSISDEARKMSHWAGKELAHRRHLQKSWYTDSFIDQYWYYGDLYTYQKGVVEFMLRSGGALNASDMGTGKTPETAVAMRNVWLEATEEPFSAIVFAKKSYLYGWRSELARWFPEATVIVFDGQPKDREVAWTIFEDAFENGQPSVLVVSHALAHKYSRLAPYGSLPVDNSYGHFNDISWDVVVVDEAQVLINPTNGTTRAIKEVAKNAEYRWALTGTPIRNNQSELWSVLNFTHPHLFPRRTAFTERYFHTAISTWGGIDVLGLKLEHEKEFRTLVDWCMIRRISTDLPILNEPQHIILPMEGRQKTVYNQLKKQFIAELEHGDVVYSDNPLKHASNLRYAASGVPIMEDNKVVGIDVSQSNKVKALQDLLEGASHPLVVYSMSKVVLNSIYEDLEDEYNLGLITGDVSSEQRQAYVDAFQKGELDALFMTSAGATSITLTAADTIVYIVGDWSMENMQQSRKRIHRHGQDKECHIIYLISEGTIDKAIFKAGEMKEYEFEELVKDKETIEKALRGEL